MFRWSLFVATTILGGPFPAAGPLAPPAGEPVLEESPSVQEIGLP
jgi:hypothetical protein